MIFLPTNEFINPPFPSYSFILYQLVLDISTLQPPSALLNETGSYEDRSVVSKMFRSIFDSVEALTFVVWAAAW